MTQQNGRTIGVLAVTVTAMFALALGWVLAYGLPEQGRDAALVMLGALGSSWTSVIAYFFGSTSGSSRKTELLAKANPIQES